MKHTVFVYGTLRQGFYNHRLLENSTFVDTGSAYGLALFDVGPFPAVLPDKNSAVHGEIYEVDNDTLARLDRLEGVPHMYRRELVFCDLDHDSDLEFEAWVYIWNGDRDRLMHIPGGDYKAHVKPGREYRDATVTI